LEKVKKTNANKIDQKLQVLLLNATIDFSRVDPHQFKNVADHIFDDLSQFFKVDTISFFSINEKEHKINRTYYWTTRQVFNVQSSYVLSSDFSFDDDIKLVKHPKQLDKHLMLKTIFNSETLEQISIHPFKIQLGLSGMIVFESHQNDVVWQKDELDGLNILSALCVNVVKMNRLQGEIEALNEHNKRIKQEKGEMLYQMSQELRTPLNGMLNAMYLMGTTNLSIEQKDYLEIGQASADIMSTVVDSVLDISKIEAGRMEIFNESFNLEEELISMYRIEKQNLDEKGLSFEFEFDYRLNHEVKGDLRKLRQILINLLSNAIKYTHQGSITIKSSLIDDKKQSVMRFEIKDTGVGISEHQVDLMNQMFRNQSDEGEYVTRGLGLSLTNELVKLMKGQMTVKSKLSEGSIVTVELPFEKGRMETYEFENQKKVVFVSKTNQHIEDMVKSIGLDICDPKDQDKHNCDYLFIEHEIAQSEEISKLIDAYGHEETKIISIHPGEQKRYERIHLYLEYPFSRMSLYQKLINLSHQEVKEEIIEAEYQSMLSGYALIVDDNRLNRITLENILFKEGVNSRSVESGPLAIDAVQKEDFDLILMDVQMPEMDGIETTRRIRMLGKKYENLPIIAVTANAFLSDYDFMKSSQMNDIVFKPIRIKHLTKVLRKYLKSSSTIQIPDELFVFDQKDFEIRFEGSFDIADEVIESFKTEYQKDLDKISQAIQKEDLDQIIETTHYFKGSCAYLSGKRAVWLLNFMMNAAKRSHLEMMLLCDELLHKEVKNLLDAIDLYQKR